MELCGDKYAHWSNKNKNTETHSYRDFMDNETFFLSETGFFSGTQRQQFNIWWVNEE